MVMAKSFIFTMVSTDLVVCGLLRFDQTESIPERCKQDQRKMMVMRCTVYSAFTEHRTSIIKDTKKNHLQKFK